MLRRERLRVTVVAGAALLIGALLLSCSRDTSTPTGPRDPATALPAAVATVTVLGAPADGLLLVGQSRPLSVDVRDAAGAALQGRSVVWSTSNAMVATASNLGVVTATATGVVTITAAVEGHSSAADFTARFAIATPSAGAAQAMTTSILNGSVSVTVPPNAIAAGSVLNVAPADAAGLPAGSQLMPNTAFAFGPDGTQFATPISLSLQVDTSSLASWESAGLAIYLLKNGSWEEVPGSTVSGDHVKAPVLHFSTYGVLRRLPPTTMSIVAGNGQTATVSTAVPVRPSVKLLDASGRGVSFVPVQFAVTNGGGSLTGASQLTDDSGTATVGGWTLGPNVGKNSLTVTAVSLTSVTVVATATALPPVGMSILAGNAQTARIGTLLPTSPAVKVVDARGNGVAGVQVQFGVTGGGGTLAGTSQVTDADGIARVGGWTLGPVLGANSIAATSAGLSSVTFTATATAPAGPPPAAIRTVSQPDLVQNGITFPSPIVVDLVDSLDVRVQSASLPVTLSMFSGNGTLAGTLTVTAVAGRATFADVRLTGPSGDNWLLLSAPGVRNTGGLRVTITPTGQSKYLRLHAPLQGVAAYAPYPEQPVVEIVDASGRRVAGATNSVFVSDFGDPTAMGGTRVVQAVDGVATFTDLQTTWAGVHRLFFTADDQNIAPVLSDFFHVATNLSVVTSPSSPTRSGALLSPQPVLMLSDYSSYAPLLTPSPGNTAYVTASVVQNPSLPAYPGTRSGTLSGTTTVRAVNGIVSFTDLRLSGLGPVRIAYSLTPPLVYTFTDLFVSPAVAQVPAQIAILAQPTTATSGVNTDFMVEVRDATGAPIFGDVHPVTVAIASGNGALVGTTTETTFQFGYTYFKSFAIAGSGPQTLVFSTGGASVKTAPITVVQVPRSVVITTQPAGTVSGLVLPTQPVVKIIDDAGLPIVAASTVTVKVANGVPVTLSGPTTVNTVNGFATFSGLKVAGGRDFELQFNIPSGLVAQSQTLRLSQVAARLNVVTQPSQAISGYALDRPLLEVLDADGERVAFTSNVVAATLKSGPGISLSGGTSPATVFGLASFPRMLLTGAGAFSLDFSYPGVPGVSSNSTVLTQLVNEVVFGTLPAGAIDGVPFTTQPTAEVRDHANLLYAVNSGTATVSIISGPGTLGGTTTVNIVDGIARFTDLKLSGKGVYVLGIATSLPPYRFPGLPPGPLTRASITVP